MIEPDGVDASLLKAAIDQAAGLDGVLEPHPHVLNAHLGRRQSAQLFEFQLADMEEVRARVSQLLVVAAETTGPNVATEARGERPRGNHGAEARRVEAG